ncbi:hypothetical protein TNCV_1515261 [Trichonephila clavipes]|nr:hypothetical protein TNCV_1515261 [Trichonephila clavipes]
MTIILHNKASEVLEDPRETFKDTRNSITEQGMAVNNVRGSAVTLFPEVPYTKVVPISVYVSGSEANFRVSIPQNNVLNLSMDIGKVWRGFHSTRPFFRPLNKPPTSI